MGENEVFEYMWLGVGLVLVAGLLSFMIPLYMAGNKMAEIQYKEDHNRAVIREMRKQLPYKDRDVLSEDIINLILQTRGEPEVWVDTTAGAGENFNWVWTESVQETPYVTDSLVTRFPPGQVYRSSIVYDSSETIVRYEFRLK